MLSLAVSVLDDIAEPEGPPKKGDTTRLREACVRLRDEIKSFLASRSPVPSEEQVEAMRGWALVPREPTEAMIQAGLNALGEWRKTLSADEALLRRSAPIENGRVWLASATPAEKADIRWRAMIAAAPNPPTGEG
jgi:hypothetical protein